MKTTILILLCVMTACALEPKTRDVDQASTAFCSDGLGPIKCWPNSFTQADTLCADACDSAGYGTGYCQDYTDGDNSFCLNHCVADSSGWHSTSANCGSTGLFCFPIFAKHCLAGFRP